MPCIDVPGFTEWFEEYRRYNGHVDPSTLMSDMTNIMLTYIFNGKLYELTPQKLCSRKDLLAQLRLTICRDPVFWLYCTEKDQETVNSVVEDVKNSEEGQELFGEKQEVPTDVSADQQAAILGMLLEKGLNIPETAPQMIWMCYMSVRKPEEIGKQGIQYSGDTAVIHFSGFKDDTSDRENSYYLEPITEEDSETSSFAFFYNCFKELEEHSKTL